MPVSRDFAYSHFPVTHFPALSSGVEFSRTFTRFPAHNAASLHNYHINNYLRQDNSD